MSKGGWPATSDDRLDDVVGPFAMTVESRLQPTSARGNR
jgi:hypothetical protein